MEKRVDLKRGAGVKGIDHVKLAVDYTMKTVHKMHDDLLSSNPNGVEELDYVSQSNLEKLVIVGYQYDLINRIKVLKNSKLMEIESNIRFLESCGRLKEPDSVHTSSKIAGAIKRGMGCMLEIADCDFAIKQISDVIGLLNDNLTKNEHSEDSLKMILGQMKYAFEKHGTDESEMLVNRVAAMMMSGCYENQQVSDPDEEIEIVKLEETLIILGEMAQGKMGRAGELGYGKDRIKNPVLVFEELSRNLKKLELEHPGFVGAMGFEGALPDMDFQHLILYGNMIVNMLGLFLFFYSTATQFGRVYDKFGNMAKAGHKAYSAINTVGKWVSGLWVVMPTFAWLIQFGYASWTGTAVTEIFNVIGDLTNLYGKYSLTDMMVSNLDYFMSWENFTRMARASIPAMVEFSRTDPKLVTASLYSSIVAGKSVTYEQIVGAIPINMSMWGCLFLVNQTLAVSTFMVDLLMHMSPALRSVMDNNSGVCILVSTLLFVWAKSKMSNEYFGLPDKDKPRNELNNSPFIDYQTLARKTVEEMSEIEKLKMRYFTSEDELTWGREQLSKSENAVTERQKMDASLFYQLEEMIANAYFGMKKHFWIRGVMKNLVFELKVLTSLNRTGESNSKERSAALRRFVYNLLFFLTQGFYITAMISNASSVLSIMGNYLIPNGLTLLHTVVSTIFEKNLMTNVLVGNHQLATLATKAIFGVGFNQTFSEMSYITIAYASTMLYFRGSKVLSDFSSALGFGGGKDIMTIAIENIGDFFRKEEVKKIQNDEISSTRVSDSGKFLVKGDKSATESNFISIPQRASFFLADFGYLINDLQRAPMIFNGDQVSDDNDPVSVFFSSMTQEMFTRMSLIEYSGKKKSFDDVLLIKVKKNNNSDYLTLGKMNSGNVAVSMYVLMTYIYTKQGSKNDEYRKKILTLGRIIEEEKEIEKMNNAISDLCALITSNKDSKKEWGDSVFGAFNQSEMNSYEIDENVLNFAQRAIEIERNSGYFYDKIQNIWLALTFAFAFNFVSGEEEEEEDTNMAFFSYVQRK